MLAPDLEGNPERGKRQKQAGANPAKRIGRDSVDDALQT